jgi:hypothetical protein
MTKPSDFMLGLLDFFAVLLPGVIATWLVSHYLPDELSGALELPSGEHVSVVPFVVYLLVSYALGHFAFGIGSNLDGPYDRWRKRSKRPEDDVAYRAAQQLRRRLTPSLDGEGFSTFKWARSYVGIHSPQARIEIDRFEASSKFFRSLVVISVALALHFLLGRHDPLMTAFSLFILVLSFWRFCDQRWKMTETTYAAAVIVHETKAKAKGGEPKAEANDEAED